jgi:hypothetical protein
MNLLKIDVLKESCKVVEEHCLKSMYYSNSVNLLVELIGKIVSKS